MGAALDLTGQQFTRWTVIELAGRNKQGERMWRCQCECGRYGIVAVGSLRSKNSKSCGCLQREAVLRLNAAKFVHGAIHTPEYRAWTSMKNRCYTLTHTQYADYGGRGIKVCSSWRRSFPNFLADMGPRPSSKHSIDRIDNNASYSPINCRWATWTEQANNTRKNRRITYNGETKNLMAWGKELGIDRSVLARRLNQGWSLGKIVNLRNARKEQNNNGII